MVWGLRTIHSLERRCVSNRGNPKQIWDLIFAPLSTALHDLYLKSEFLVGVTVDDTNVQV
jgi:hypothetical protein